jgi:hypothetical protein
LREVYRPKGLLHHHCEGIDEAFTPVEVLSTLRCRRWDTARILALADLHAEMYLRKRREIE